MQITLYNITEDQLDDLIAKTTDDPKLQNVYWQLRGYWMVGGDELNPTNIVPSTDN